MVEVERGDAFDILELDEAEAFLVPAFLLFVGKLELGVVVFDGFCNFFVGEFDEVLNIFDGGFGGNFLGTFFHEVKFFACENSAMRDFAAGGATNDHGFAAVENLV